MKNPNIILISIDTLRADHLSCYGYHRQTTPNIDRLASEGALFKNAYSTAVWTPPAHASMFTGLYPSQHGVVGFKKLAPDIPTIAEVLSNNGYNTVGFVNNPAAGEFVGLDRGHQKFYEIWRGITTKNLFVRGIHFLYRNWLAILGIQDHGAQKTNKLLKKWLRSEAIKDRPFYIFIHHIEPHNPLNAPYPFKKKFVTSKPFQAMDLDKLKKVAHNPLICYTDHIKLNQDEIDYLISMYDGEIAYVDKMVGEIIEMLRELQILDDTMIILTADHGEHFGEHNLFSHVASLYEPIVHIPLIIRYPHLYKSLQKYDHPVQVIDIFPTILDLVNDKNGHLKNLPGQSLLPRNGRIEIDENRSIFAEWEGRIPEFVKNRLNILNKTQQEVTFIMKKRSMVRQGDEKYIYCDDGNEELFNLECDPDELNNLAHKKERCKDLKDLLFNTLETNIATENDLKKEMDDIVKQRLQGLGYI